MSFSWKKNFTTIMKAVEDNACKWTKGNAAFDFLSQCVKVVRSFKIFKLKISIKTIRPCFLRSISPSYRIIMFLFRPIKSVMLASIRICIAIELKRKCWFQQSYTKNCRLFAFEVRIKLSYQITIQLQERDTLKYIYLPVV